MKLPTVEVVNPRNPAYMVRINESDFDAELHTLWSAKDALQTQEKEATEEVELGSMEARYLALADLGWREIKQLYENEYGLGDYPGKDEAIAAILKHESFE